MLIVNKSKWTYTQKHCCYSE